MLLLVLLFCCAVAGSFACSDRHCKDRRLGNELMSVKFMPNRAQLRRLCPKAISFMECEKRFFECPGQTLEEMAISSNKQDVTKAQAMLGGLSLVYDICDEDSSFHQDYIASVDCFRTFAETFGTQCRKDIVKPVEEFFDQLYPNQEEMTEKIAAEVRCLSDALELGCIAHNLGESCGSVAQRTAMTVLERLTAYVKAGACGNVENAAELKARFLDFLELDEDKRSNIQSVFDLVKRRR